MMLKHALAKRHAPNLSTYAHKRTHPPTHARMHACTHAHWFCICCAWCGLEQCVTICVCVRVCGRWWTHSCQ